MGSGLRPLPYTSTQILWPKCVANFRHSKAFAFLTRIKCFFYILGKLFTIERPSSPLQEWIATVQNDVDTCVFVMRFAVNVSTVAVSIIEVKSKRQVWGKNWSEYLKREYMLRKRMFNHTLKCTNYALPLEL